MAHEELVRSITEAMQEFERHNVLGDKLKAQARAEYVTADDSLRHRADDMAKLYCHIMSQSLATDEIRQSSAYIIIVCRNQEHVDVDLCQAILVLADASGEVLSDLDRAARKTDFPSLRAIFCTLQVEESKADYYAMAIMKLYRSTGCCN